MECPLDSTMIRLVAITINCIASQKALGALPAPSHSQLEAMRNSSFCLTGSAVSAIFLAKAAYLLK